MAGIDKTNLRSMATDIAKQLDQKDNNKGDGKIEASIWNEFVADKGGRQIKNSITLENAIKSITTYIARNAAKTGEAFGDIADKWFNKTSPIEKVVTPPVRQVPASELPPQQFKMPENIPEVKPLPYTENDLEEMFVEPGKDVLKQRACGKTVGETIALVIAEGGGFEEPVSPKRAAYAFAALMDGIPDLAEKFDAHASEVIKNIYSGLIARAEELEIDLLEETGLQSIDIENTTPKEQIKICKAISEAISAHDESAINEMNMYQSIKTPNPELAGKTIEDKVSGKTYVYNEKGQIIEAKNKDGELILGDKYNYNNGWVDLIIDDENKTDLAFDLDSDFKFPDAYEEEYIEQGFRWSVSRDENGQADLVMKLSLNRQNNGVIESWSQHSGLGYMKHATDTSSNKPITEHYDGNGNLTYYQEFVRDSDIFTYRDNNGVLIGTHEHGGADWRNVGSYTVYRNADGELLATEEVVNYSEESGLEYIYKDADGNEISEEQFNELVDERLR